MEKESLYDHEKYENLMPTYLYLRNEADATDQEAIFLNPKEIELLYQIRNHTTLEGFFSGKILKVWKDEGSKPIYINTLKKLSDMNLIFAFPEFKFLPETSQLTVGICLTSEKQFKPSNRENLKEIYLNSLSKSSFAIQNYILGCEPFQISELISIFEYLIAGSASTFVRDSFDIKKWIHSFTFSELLKEETIKDSIQIIFETIHENEHIAVTKTTGLFHVADDLSGKAFDILKSYYLNQFSKRLKEKYQTAWDLITEHRKEIVIDVNYSGSISSMEEKFVSEELKIIGESLGNLVPETFKDFLILANYISRKHDHLKNLRSSAEELKSIKMLKTMMSMKSDALSQFVMINLDEDKEFSYSIVDNLKRDPDCISCDWYEKGKKISCICQKKEETILNLIHVMIEKYSYKKDLVRIFLFLLKKEKNELAAYYRKSDFKEAILKLKYVCYKENLSWFSKILSFLGAFGFLESSLEHEESIIQFEQLTREIAYKENRKKLLDKVRAEWLIEAETEPSVTEVEETSSKPDSKRSVNTATVRGGK
ncbi:exonuclease [Leptospira stimsonii]|uniref:Exonuclease n=1 Tax=Leptospira stimsonii TaxID=2202203 RepID=A0ABY2N3V5_9LEPT|nr:exonuclease [Leptospira stimsonii]TGM16510.1 exonuclease [Leptospira stimsonii]